MKVFLLKMQISMLASLIGVVWGQTTVLCDDLRTAVNPIYQGTDGWFFRTVDLERVQDFEEFEQLAIEIQRLSKALAEMNINLVISLVPSRGMIYGDLLDVSQRKTAGFDLEVARGNYLTFIENLRSRDVLAIDLLTPALDSRTEGDFSLRLDGHWTSEGATSAQAIALQLSELSPAYSSLEKSIFTTELKGAQPREGVIQKRIEGVCANTIPDELISEYITYKTSQSDGLLGDTAIPVILVGSSFSGNAFNFEGFLAEFLGLDVVSNFVAGGGMFTSFQDYLQSPGYLTNPPSYIVWEFTMPMTRPDELDLDMFRQLLPSVYGNCPASSVVAQQSTLLSESEVTVFEGQQGALIAPFTIAYLVQNFEDKSLVNFEEVLNYEDGSRQTFVIDRSTRVQNTGLYFVEVSTESPLQRVTLKLPDAVTGSLEVTLCQQ